MAQWVFKKKQLVLANGTFFKGSARKKQAETKIQKHIQH